MLIIRNVLEVPATRRNIILLSSIFYWNVFNIHFVLYAVGSEVAKIKTCHKYEYQYEFIEATLSAFVQQSEYNE